MSTKVQPGQTIRIGPGLFATSGYPSWELTERTRVIGSGIGVTTIQITNAPLNSAARAFGSGAALIGFELSDLTIDCNLPAPSADVATRAGCFVTGKNIYIRRVRCINFGSLDSGKQFSVFDAAGGDYAENIVFEECIAELPSAHDTSDSCAFFGFSGSSKFCVLRNCAGRALDNFDNPVPAISSSRYRSVETAACVGLVIEGNRFANVAIGLNCAEPPVDLVIWNNVFRNVWIGINSEQTTELGRLIAVNNLIELASMPGSISNPIGIHIASTVADYNKQVILRKNFIQDVQVPLGQNPDLYGIIATRCKELIIEDNLINNAQPSQAVIVSACSSSKTFNNQNTAGVLLRAYDGSGAYTMELADEVEDVYLNI
jgi:hypothetical protein